MARHERYQRGRADAGLPGSTTRDEILGSRSIRSGRIIGSVSREATAASTPHYDEKLLSLESDGEVGKWIGCVMRLNPRLSSLPPYRQRELNDLGLESIFEIPLRDLDVAAWYAPRALAAGVPFTKTWSEAQTSSGSRRRRASSITSIQGWTIPNGSAGAGINGALMDAWIGEDGSHAVHSEFRCPPDTAAFDLRMPGGGRLPDVLTLKFNTRVFVQIGLSLGYSLAGVRPES